MYKIEIEIVSTQSKGNGGELQKDDGGIIYPNVVKEGICAWMYRGDGKASYQQGQRSNILRIGEKSAHGWPPA